MLGHLADLRNKAAEKLRELDKAWTQSRSKEFKELANLANQFAFLDRWTEQLRERQFQLTT
jgi:hypothetical protein